MSEATNNASPHQVERNKNERMNREKMHTHFMYCAVDKCDDVSTVDKKIWHTKRTRLLVNLSEAVAWSDVNSEREKDGTAFLDARSSTKHKIKEITIQFR